MQNLSSIEEMPVEVIRGQIVAKANHYQAVPDGRGGRRIIKDDKIREYERSFISQCRLYKGRQINVPCRLEADFYYISKRFDVDNSIKTLADCLQYVGAITNDNLIWDLQARKHIDKLNPRVEFRIMPIDLPTQAGELDLFP